MNQVHLVELEHIEQHGHGLRRIEPCWRSRAQTKAIVVGQALRSNIPAGTTVPESQARPLVGQMRMSDNTFAYPPSATLQHERDRKWPHRSRGSVPSITWFGTRSSESGIRTQSRKEALAKTRPTLRGSSAASWSTRKGLSTTL